MMASGPGKDQPDRAHEPVHGREREQEQREESAARAPSAAAAGVSSPPPSPGREEPGDGRGGGDGSSSATPVVDRKDKRVVFFISSSSSSTPEPDSASSGSLPALADAADVAASGAGASSSGARGEMDTWYQQEMAVMLKMARGRVRPRAELNQSVRRHGQSRMEEIKETMAPWAEAGEKEKQEDKLIIPGKKKSLFSKVKHYFRNKFLGRKRRSLYLSNQNSPECCSPKSSVRPHVNYQIIPIVEAVTYYWHLQNPKAQDLFHAYSGFRPVKGDGECFYRSFIFSYLEQVLDRQDMYEEQRLLDAVKSLARQNADLGCTSDGFFRSRMAFEKLIEEIKSWKSQGSSSSEASASSYCKQNLLEFFNTPYKADYIFCFLRSVVAIWIFSHREDYEHLVVSSSLENWCRRHLASGQDADHLLMVALAQALEVPLHVVQIEGPDQDIYSGAGGHQVSRVTVTLLYSSSPGHYDIIYPLPPAEGSSEQAAQGERLSDQDSSKQTRQRERPSDQSSSKQIKKGERPYQSSSKQTKKGEKPDHSSSKQTKKGKRPYQSSSKQTKKGERPDQSSSKQTRKEKDLIRVGERPDHSSNKQTKKGERPDQSSSKQIRQGES